MPSVGNKNNEAADGTDEPSSSAIAQKAQEFDYKLFAHNVGLFVDYMQPLFIMHECSLSLKNWDYPWLSLSLFIFLLTAAYHNLTVHLPAVLVGSNLLVLAYCRYDATRVKKALKIDHEEEDIKEAEAEYDYKTSNVFSRFSKWKQRVKVNMSKVMSGLESMHDFLSIVNDKLVRFGCLYLWSTTKASTYYTLAMVTFGLLYYCLPFNVLFALWVTDFFTDKFQPQHPDGNLFMRLLAMVHVTDRIDPTASVIPFCVCCNACVIHPAFTTEAPPEGVHESKESSAAGWLEKRRGFLGKWHPRWFVIGGSHLVYYQSEADVGQTAPKGVVHLSHAVISDAGPGEKGGTQLYIQEPLKAKMTLQASSVGEKHQWLVALTDARLKSPVLPAAFEVLPDEHPQPPKK